MKRRAFLLDALTVKNAGPGKHADGACLYLAVEEDGRAYWFYMYTRHAKRRQQSLGPARGQNAVTLAKARDLAAESRRLLAAGVDPLEQKAAKAEAEKSAVAVAARAAVTFRQEAEAHIEAHAPGWKNAKHRAQWSSTLRAYAYPIIGDKAVASISTEDVLAVLRPIWQAKPETAKRLRGRIEAVLVASTVKGLRPQGLNPAAWKGHLDQLLASRSKFAPIKHHPALPYSEAPAFFLRVQAADGLGARALELTILTAVRTNEAIGAAWAEIDLDGAVWTIPKERMKAQREHRVPLSTAAVALLRKMATVKEGEHVFAGQRQGRHLSDMAMLMALRRLGRDDLTAHGFRSTFRDWAAEVTSFPSEVVEMALAHAVGDKVEAAYRRGDLFDKRRKLMEAWARYCTSPAAAPALLRRVS